MGRISDAREKLLQVAFDLIYDHSYGTVSVDHICKRARVNKGSFYYFFRTKTELVIEAYEEHWRLKRPDYDRIFSTQVPPLKRLEMWCDYICEVQRKRFEKYEHVCGCPYTSVGSELATCDEKVRLKAMDLIERTVKYVESAIVDAKREGLVQVDNATITAQQIHAYIQGLLLRAKIYNDLKILRQAKPTVQMMAGARTVSA
ncbi:MAG TPA: TetR/AcrR family transcriptional regulator [Verrucomicrobiae bacterium]|nr:TetR/AcrR family transcriptional regulator [Verrucomicrobiae bacterium]